MTLIAAIDLYDTPILIGDVIISQIGVSEPHAPIPTRTDLENVVPREWFRTIKGVRRKLTKINDWLVVGWAGHQIAAQVLLEKLKVRFESKQIEREHLFQFLTGFEDLGSGINCTLVGWLVDREGAISFKWNSQSKALVSGRQPYIAGSGAKALTKILREGRFESGSKTTPNPIHQALSYAGHVLVLLPKSF
jgi:hypothetical protein